MSTVSIGYVEFRTIELVDKALALTGTVVMGLPIMVQLTESERNKLHPGDGSVPPYLALFPNGTDLQTTVISIYRRASVPHTEELCSALFSVIFNRWNETNGVDVV